MDRSLQWANPGKPAPLAANELHVWRACLNPSPAIHEQFKRTLNPDEVARSEKFSVPHARERYVAARGILRQLLGGYLDLEPAKVEFVYGPQGKPRLSRAHDSDIFFNVSHSQTLGLFAFAKGQEVGVDVEEVRTDFKGMEIANRFFSDEEAAALSNLPPKLAEEGFFNCWTKKEAYVKAVGVGMGISLRSFTVHIDKDFQLVRGQDETRWSCFGLRPAAGYIGAVAAAGEGWNLNCYEWSAEGG